MIAILASRAWIFVRHWAGLVAIERWSVSDDGTRVITYRVPLDQLVINYAVAGTLYLLAFGLSMVPFGQDQDTTIIIRDLVELAGRLT